MLASIEDLILEEKTIRRRSALRKLWIKPGSGKSTLMKYIYEHPATSNLLQKWADTVPVLTAAFRGRVGVGSSGPNAISSGLFCTNYSDSILISFLAHFRIFGPKSGP